MAEKEIDPKIKDKIIGNVYKKAMSLKEKGYAVKDQASDVKKWLEEQEDVEEVLVHKDTDITVKFKDKTQIGILLNRKDMYGSGEGKGENPVIESYDSAKHLEDPHPVSTKAAVIDTLYDDWPPHATPDTINTLLGSKGYDVNYVKNNNANLGFFANLDDGEYGVVFIRSHGGMLNVGGDNKLHIIVRPFFATFPPASGYNGVQVFTVGTDVLPQGWAYVYGFNNLFVQQYMNNKPFPNSLFHLLVCHGGDPLAVNDMINAFLDKGVGCYTGWTKNASSTHGDPAAVMFFQALCDSSASPTNTVADAINQITGAGHSPDPGTGAVLSAYGLSAMQIINCFIIKEVSHITLQTSGGIVVKKGFHDILDAMEYATNRIIGGKYSKLRITQSVDLEKISW
jgi:hypothetical protein